MHRAVLLAICLVLAGCLGGADTDPKNDPRPPRDPSTPPSTAPPATDPKLVLLADFGFQDCQGIEASMLVETEAAQALLPENYTVLTGQGPPQHPAQSLARWRILTCPTFASPTTSLNDTVYGEVALAIEDPGLGDTDASAHWYRLTIFSRDDRLAIAWLVAGYETVKGDVALQQGSTPLGTDASLSFAGYEATWLPLQATSADGSGAYFTATGAGLITWQESVQAESAMEAFGTFSVPSADPLAELVSEDPSRLTLIEHAATQVEDATAIRHRDL